MVVGKLDTLRVAELTGDIPQNVNFAIKASVLLNFLEAQGVETETAARAPARRDADLATASREITVRVDCLR